MEWTEQDWREYLDGKFNRLRNEPNLTDRLDAEDSFLYNLHELKRMGKAELAKEYFERYLVYVGKKR